MSVDITNVDYFIPKHLRNTAMYSKLSDMMTYVLETSVEEFKDVKYKFTRPNDLGPDAVQAIIEEQGFNYITDVMKTMEGLEFNTMLSFMDMVNQLKGTRKGLELVLKLLGFDSIIQEWWEDTTKDVEKWTYEIIVIVNSSNVPDIFSTIEKIKIFSDNYVLAGISNINVKFNASKFAELGAIMGGFEKPTHRGYIIQRVN